MPDFIHNDSEFRELLSIVSTKKGIDITLIEKDYWIMHALYSLQQQGIEFELKGWILRTIVYHLFQSIVYQCFSPKFTTR